MKITLRQDPSFPERKVIINCPQADEEILHLVAMLRIHQRKLVGTREGENHLLDAKDILYIDTADKQTFLYTKGRSMRAPCGSMNWRRGWRGWIFCAPAGQPSSISAMSSPFALNWAAGCW